MKKTLTALTTAAALFAAVSVAPTDALAQRRGAGVAAGLLGGLVAGTIIGGAIATAPGYAYPAYAPAPGFVPYPAYAAPIPVACPGGYWARQPVYNPYGAVVGWSRPRFFCP